jgi:hypothetical protein
MRIAIFDLRPEVFRGICVWTSADDRQDRGVEVALA